MIRQLIILLLIVGCAHKPPSAQFYIGMTEEEFLTINKIGLISDGNFSQTKINNNNIYYQRINENSLHSHLPKMFSENVIRYTESEYKYLRWMSPYSFTFINDSLKRVSKGLINDASEKHIDYDKYANPPE